ncbi:protein of unknown function [Nitratireductor aquimarinus]|uniref:hypothetical protein n=1 Tax=Nitratireductor aquimarinus TaxID=889300 RepID=UPI003B5B6C48
MEKIFLWVAATAKSESKNFVESFKMEKNTPNHARSGEHIFNVRIATQTRRQPGFRTTVG